MRPIDCVSAIKGTLDTLPPMLTPKVSQVSATTAHPPKPKRKQAPPLLPGGAALSAQAAGSSAGHPAK